MSWRNLLLDNPATTVLLTKKANIRFLRLTRRAVGEWSRFLGSGLEAEAKQLRETLFVVPLIRFCHNIIWCRHCTWMRKHFFIR